MKLEVNDRVRVYSNSYVFNGIVKTVLNADQIMVKDSDCEFVVYVKQCRKLVKRQRREWWIRLCTYDDEHEIITPVESESACTHCEVIRVREMKEKK